VALQEGRIGHPSISRPFFTFAASLSLFNEVEKMVGAAGFEPATYSV
jgi:hypothetical protein